MSTYPIEFSRLEKQIKVLEKNNRTLEQRNKALEQLLACYRLKRSVSESLREKLKKTY